MKIKYKQKYINMKIPNIIITHGLSCLIFVVIIISLKFYIDYLINNKFAKLSEHKKKHNKKHQEIKEQIHEQILQQQNHEIDSYINPISETVSEMA